MQCRNIIILVKKYYMRNVLEVQLDFRMCYLIIINHVFSTTLEKYII